MRVSLQKSFCLVFTFVLATMLCQCTKEEDDTDVEIAALATEKSEYTPLEIVTLLSPDADLAEETVAAEINGVTVDVVLSGASAAFILPDLPDGGYYLTFKSSGTQYSVYVKVAAASPAAAPDVYFNDLKNSILGNITVLNEQILILQNTEGNETEVTALQNDAALYNTMLTDYTAQYNSLSAADKADFAKFIAANQATIDDYNNMNALFAQTITPLGKSGSIQDYETDTEASMYAFKQSVKYTVAHIPVFLLLAQVAKSPMAWLSIGSIVGAGLVLTSFAINVMETGELGFILTTKAIKPFLDMDITQTVYEAGQEVSASVTAQYRTIFAGDDSDGTNGEVINDGKTYYNLLEEKITALKNKLPTFVRPQFSIPPLKSTFKTATRLVYNAYVKFTNVSNPNVTLQKIDQADGTFLIKATTESLEPQYFTYDIEYKNSKFTTGLKQTISAQVVPEDDTEMYRLAAVGSWTYTWYNEGSAVEWDYYVLDADGTGHLASIKNLQQHDFYAPGDTVYAITWGISHNEDGYYLNISHTDWPTWGISEIMFLDPARCGDIVDGGLYVLGTKD